MNIPEIYRDLIAELATATEARSIEWKHVHDTVFAHVLDDLSLEVRAGQNEGDEPWVAVSIRNSTGELIDNFWTEESDTDYNQLLDFYSKARRSALKVNEAIQKLRISIRRKSGPAK